MEYCIHTKLYVLQTPSPDDVPVSNLMAQVLSALYLLVKFGYYDDYSDVEDVLRPLTTLLGENHLLYVHMHVHMYVCMYVCILQRQRSVPQVLRIRREIEHCTKSNKSMTSTIICITTLRTIFFVQSHGSH